MNSIRAVLLACGLATGLSLTGCEGEHHNDDHGHEHADGDPSHADDHDHGSEHEGGDGDAAHDGDAEGAHDEGDGAGHDDDG